MRHKPMCYAIPGKPKRAFKNLHQALHFTRARPNVPEDIQLYPYTCDACGKLHLTKRRPTPPLYPPNNGVC